MTQSTNVLKDGNEKWTTNGVFLCKHLMKFMYTKASQKRKEPRNWRVQWEHSTIQIDAKMGDVVLVRIRIEMRSFFFTLKIYVKNSIHFMERKTRKSNLNVCRWMIFAKFSNAINFFSLKEWKKKSTQTNYIFFVWLNVVVNIFFF